MHIICIRAQQLDLCIVLECLIRSILAWTGMGQVCWCSRVLVHSVARLSSADTSDQRCGTCTSTAQGHRSSATENETHELVSVQVVAELVGDNKLPWEVMSRASMHARSAWGSNHAAPQQRFLSWALNAGVRQAVQICLINDLGKNHRDVVCE
jgi:hypothetical protein